MGTRHDAEFIQLNDIVYATDLMAGVDHVLTPPPGKATGLREGATGGKLTVSFCCSFRARCHVLSFCNSMLNVEQPNCVLDAVVV